MGHFCCTDFCHLTNMWSHEYRKSFFLFKISRRNESKTSTVIGSRSQSLSYIYIKCHRINGARFKGHVMVFYSIRWSRGRTTDPGNADLIVLVLWEWKMLFRIWTRALPAPHTVGRWDIRSCVCHTLCTWPCVRTQEAHSQWVSPYRSCRGSPPRPAQSQCLHANKGNEKSKMLHFCQKIKYAINPYTDLKTSCQVSYQGKMA